MNFLRWNQETSCFSKDNFLAQVWKILWTVCDEVYKKDESLFKG